jgi:hypothetical protein
MRIKIITFLFFLAIATNCFSQNKLQTDITDITKATFVNPGISYEKKIGKFQSILGQAFINTSFSISYSSSLGNTSSITFDPALSFQYRYYYNYDKRQKKGKRTEMNSLNYLSPTFETIFSKNRISTSHYIENNRRPINTVGVVWGIQRNYRKRFSLDFNLGLGYLFTTASLPDNTGLTIKENIGKLSSLGQLNLGFWLNKRK